ncbi:MAG: diguanylate cyclase [Acidimicrobiales bacterium]
MSEIDASFDLGEFASSSRLLCAITTRAGRVLWANDTLGRAFGPEASALVNRPFVELLDPYDRAQAIRGMTRLDGPDDEVAFDARLHPVAGGFRAAWSWRVGRDGLLYALGVEAEPEPEPIDEATGLAPTELRELVARDHLTGTANRRTFETALEHQLDRCRRDGLSLSVALVDLDRFKHYNDTFGHLAGDECLVTVARAIQQRASRTGELVGRFGGDEFLVLWPGIDLATAQRNANRIRDAVRVLDLRIADQPMHVSVSIGGITIVPTEETTGTALVHAADRAMYAAKRAGGDDTRWVTDPAQVHEGETATP